MIQTPLWSAHANHEIRVRDNLTKVCKTRLVEVIYIVDERRRPDEGVTVMMAAAAELMIITAFTNYTDSREILDSRLLA